MPGGRGARDVRLPAPPVGKALHDAIARARHALSVLMSALRRDCRALGRVGLRRAFRGKVAGVVEGAMGAQAPWSASGNVDPHGWQPRRKTRVDTGGLPALVQRGLLASSSGILDVGFKNNSCAFSKSAFVCLPCSRNTFFTVKRAYMPFTKPVFSVY